MRESAASRCRRQKKRGRIFPAGGSTGGHEGMRECPPQCRFARQLPRRGSQGGRPGMSAPTRDGEIIRNAELAKGDNKGPHSSALWADIFPVRGEGFPLRRRRGPGAIWSRRQAAPEGAARPSRADGEAQEGMVKGKRLFFLPPGAAHSFFSQDEKKEWGRIGSEKRGRIAATGCARSGDDRPRRACGRFVNRPYEGTGREFGIRNWRGGTTRTSSVSPLG